MTFTEQTESERRAQRRGYAINWKMLSLAFGIEGAIIFCGLFAGYEFANRYATDPVAVPTRVASLEWFMTGWQPLTNQAWWMAVIATAGVCVAEMARVPLAIAVRTQRSWWWSFWALIGVLMMCIVTTKTMSQVMEQMFHPRLRFVQAANAELLVEQKRLDEIGTKKGAVNVELVALEKAVRDAEDRRNDANLAITENNKNIEQQGEAPKPRAVKKTVQSTCSNGKTGRKRKTWKCPKTITEWVTDPWAGQQFSDRDAALQAQLTEAEAVLKAAQEKYNAALAKTTNVAELITAQQSVITEKSNNLQKAISESQLHSFTAMVFGKDPREITDGQVHWFLRFFVFLPAVMIAIASTLLALTSIQRIRPDKKVDVNSPIIAKFIQDTTEHYLTNRQPKEA